LAPPTFQLQKFQLPDGCACLFSLQIEAELLVHLRLHADLTMPEEFLVGDAIGKSQASLAF
jgi:hypothetical protein